MEVGIEVRYLDFAHGINGRFGLGVQALNRDSPQQRACSKSTVPTFIGTDGRHFSDLGAVNPAPLPGVASAAKRRAP